MKIVKQNTVNRIISISSPLLLLVILVQACKNQNPSTSEPYSIQSYKIEEQKALTPENYTDENMF